MTVGLARDNLISPEEYLREEECAERKHEFLNGLVYERAEVTRTENRVAANILGALATRLTESSCEPFGSGMKVRIQAPGDVRFYYPDVQVVCNADDPDAIYHDEPVLVMEVISEATRRVDGGEKKAGYLLLPAVQLYLLVETETALVVAYRRELLGFVHESYSGLEATVPMPFLKIELPLAEVYARVEFRAPGVAVAQ